jgi:hypothetical protein
MANIRVYIVQWEALHPDTRLYQHSACTHRLDFRLEGNGLE